MQSCHKIQPPRPKVSAQAVKEPIRMSAESNHEKTVGNPSGQREEPEREETVFFGYKRVTAAQKEKLVTDHFDSIAGKYDFMNTLLSAGIHHLWKRQAVRMLGLGPGDRVIDVCAGTGDLAILACRYLGPKGRVVLYDRNRAMMEAGRPKAAKRGLLGKISYVLGDAERIAARDNSFDAAMVGFGIRNLTHIEKGFEEMHRVLKPGGRLLCLEFSTPVSPWFRRLYDFYSFRVMPFVGEILTGRRQAYTYLPESIRLFPDPPALSSLLERIGFESVHFQRLTNGIAVIHTGLKKAGV